MTIVVRGIRGLARKLDQIERGINAEVKRGLPEAAELVADEARRRVPVLSGELRRSIEVGTARTKTRGQVVAVGSNSPYAKATEFGYRNRAARPFLWPAFQEKRDEIIREQFIQRLRGTLRAVR